MFDGQTNLVVAFRIVRSETPQKLFWSSCISQGEFIKIKLSTYIYGHDLVHGIGKCIGFGTNSEVIFKKHLYHNKTKVL